MKDKALFLDFDGVLFNTIKEVYLINRYLYKKTDFFEPVDNNNYEIYSKYKYLIYDIRMFYYYNPLIFDGTKEEKIEEIFFGAINNRDIKKENLFCENFLNARRKLILNHYDFWKNLEEPYQFFFEIKKIYKKNKNIIIVSKKNKDSILERFKTYDFNLSPNCVFAHETLDKYNSKGEFLKEYIDKNAFNSAIFVDDNNNNIDSIKDNPLIIPILASWGNTDPKTRGETEKEALDKIKAFLNV